MNPHLLILATLLLGIARVIAIIIALALGVGACGHAQAKLSFAYHNTTEAQAAELDCVLGLFSETALEAGGSVWVVESLGADLWGRTRGPDDYLTVDLVDVPALPQVFAHELVHVLAGQETGDRDPRHANPTYFGRGSLVDRMMHEAYALCQPRGL